MKIVLSLVGLTLLQTALASRIIHVPVTSHTPDLYQGSRRSKLMCSLHNASGVAQQVRMDWLPGGTTSHFNGINGAAATPLTTSLNTTVNSQSSYNFGWAENVPNSEMAGWAFFAKGLPRAFTLTVTPDQGFLTGYCYFLFESPAGYFHSHQISIASGRPF